MPRRRGRHKQLRARAFLPSLVALPLALLVGAWAINAMQDETARPQAGPDRKPVVENQAPVIPPVPDNPFMEPAHAPGPTGEIGLGVGAQPAESVVSSLKQTGIPTSALRAYALAQAAMVEADKACHLPWTLVAAIGRVESNHGRVDESVLTRQGKAVPAIVGPSLDGGPGLPSVEDTDGGQVDRDGSFDRAVGPMQFLPETWRSIGVDADRDQALDPQDVDDATLASAVYLCSGSDDLATGRGLKEALARYNDSSEYIRLVVAVKKAYEAGQWRQVADGRQLPETSAPKTPGSPDPNAPDPEPTGGSSDPGPAPGPDAPDPTGGPVPPPNPDPAPVPPTSAPKPDPDPGPPGPQPTKQPSPGPVPTDSPTSEPPPSTPDPTPSTEEDDDGGLELPIPLPPLPIPLPLLLAPV